MQTSSSANDSIALGNQSLARHQGAQIFANGRFASSGDIQNGKYLLRTHSVNGASTEAFLDGTGGSKRLVLPDDSTWNFTITVTAHQTDVNTGRAGYKLEGVIYRGAGSSSVQFQGTPIKTVIAQSNVEWDINTFADTNNGSLGVKVIGQTNKTIRWAVLIETLEVTN